MHAVRRVPQRLSGGRDKDRIEEKMPRIRIDNITVDVPAGATILDAARKAGIDIPTLCHRQGHPPMTSCLVCVVRVNGASRLVPSCATLAQEGMVVASETPDVLEARRTALELLLADHVGDCVAPCTQICPAHMDIPRMLQAIARGDDRQALIIVKQAIALPATLGRICPELCEKGCRRGDVDEPVAICKMKRHAADMDLFGGNPWLPQRRPPSGRSVAIVGAGPAGLAAAWYLSALGHACTIFDDHPLPGGALRYAVPEDLLPREVLDAEISLILRLGATFRGEFVLGRDAGIQDLLKQYSAVLVATGPADAAKLASFGVPLLAGRGPAFDKNTLMTRAPGVFLAGGVITPYKHAIRAVADGRHVAASIHQYLSGAPVVGEDRLYSIHIGRLKGEELAVLRQEAAEAPRQQADVRSGAIPPALARVEASRCLQCQCSADCTCTLRQLSARLGANQRRFTVQRRPVERVIVHPGVVYERNKCIACGLCIQVAEEAREELGLTWVGRGFNIRVAVPLDGRGRAALMRCAAECVEVCPTGALSFTSAAACRCAEQTTAASGQERR